MWLVTVICLCILGYLIYEVYMYGDNLGKAFDFLEEERRGKYERYTIFYKRKTARNIPVEIETVGRYWIKISDVMILGELKDSGKTEVVEYTGKIYRVKESYKELKDMLYEK